MTDLPAPKVFISHASEDKQHFVMPFAKRLMESGVDAWVDEWEIAPGDSLVDKIFEEGLKNAQAIVIILSTNSVNKPWVREELNAGVVNKITRNTKIIPVLIDDCEVPESLRSTLWERIEDIDNYETSFRRILSAIFDIREKPTLGTPPSYVRLQVDKIPGLSARDTTVLKVACQVSLETGSRLITNALFKNALVDLGLVEDDIIESLEILGDRMLIKVTWTMGGGLPLSSITTHGFENYGKSFLDNFDELINTTLFTIINYDLYSNGKIATHLSVSPILIEYILDILESRRYIRLIRTLSGSDNVHVHKVTTAGRRFAEQLR